MESFKIFYVEACEKLKISTCEKVLLQIENCSNANSLNLSGIQLSNDSCKAFREALEKDVHIQELDCSSCLFSVEGLESILDGLEKNKFISTLHFRGNNLRSSGGILLGKLLRHNHHLQSLNLEWNSLGVFPEKFALLCEGLCFNCSLRKLNLRNNQLNHICSQSICDMLLRNVTLQQLDLRWNNIGLIGARGILKALNGNKSLIALDVTGNDLPSDLLEAIEIAVKVSSERYLLNNEYLSRSKYLAAKLQKKEEERNMQIKALLEQLEKTDNNLSNLERINAKKFAEVEEVLDEKSKANENLLHKLLQMEKDLCLASKEKEELINKLQQLEERDEKIRKESDKFLKNKQYMFWNILAEHELYGNCKAVQSLDLEKDLCVGKLSSPLERKEQEQLEQDMFAKMSLLKEDNFSLKFENQELKKQNTLYESEINLLKLTLDKLRDELKLEKKLFTEKISQLKQEHSRVLESNKLSNQAELLQLQEEFKEVKGILEQKTSVLKTKNKDLEKEMKAKSTEVLSVKSHSEEMLMHLEKRLKSEHEMMKQQLEDRIDLLEDANKDQNDSLQANLQTIHQLKTDIMSLELELAEQSHEVHYLQQRLLEKDGELKSHEAKIKLEVKEKLCELKRAKEIIKELEDKDGAFQKEITGIIEKHRTEIQEKNEQIHVLTLEIKRKEQKLQEVLDDEKSRSLKLQRAFKTFLTTESKDS